MSHTGRARTPVCLRASAHTVGGAPDELWAPIRGVPHKLAGHQPQLPESFRITDTINDSALIQRGTLTHDKPCTPTLPEETQENGSTMHVQDENFPADIRVDVKDTPGNLGALHKQGAHRPIYGQAGPLCWGMDQ